MKELIHLQILRDLHSLPVETDNERSALAQAFDHVNAIGKRDDNKQGGSFNRILLRNFLRSYARNIGTPASLQLIALPTHII